MNIKRFVGISILLGVIGFNVDSFAQDTLIMKTNAEIVGKITEINQTEIKYKKADNINGPVYVANKWEVSKVKYSNGTTDVFNLEKPLSTSQNNPELIKNGGFYFYGDKKLKERQMQATLLSFNNPEITHYVKRARTDKGLQYVGFGAIPLGGLALIVGSTILNYVRKPTDGQVAAAGVLAGLGVVCIGTSIYFKIDRKRSNATAVKLYNKNLR
ncbi:MAG: hypothetical protein V4608_03560 [Bacteroidota bacterium]